MTERMTVKQFVGNPEVQVTAEVHKRLMPWFVKHEELINTWFQGEIVDNSIELPLNSDEFAGVGIDMPLAVYTPVNWEGIPEEEKPRLRTQLPEGQDEPAADFSVLRVTLNDASIVEFIKAQAIDEPLTEQYYLAIMMRHYVGENAHRVYPMWKMNQLLKAEEQALNSAGALDVDVIETEVIEPTK